MYDPAAGNTSALLITEQLHQRASRPPDHEAENGALGALAQALADAPDTILQVLAEKVVELLGTGSAGLSLLTKDGQRFCWAAIAGQWSAHFGMGAPRKFGPSGEILADYLRWLVGRIRDLAPTPGYRPRLHLDLYGCAGLAVNADVDAVADYLAGLAAIAHPYDLAIEHPIDAGSREAQIATYRSLRAALRARGSNVRIVVDEWCNTLDDVRAFVAAAAADVIHVKTPDLGGVGSAVEALLLARDAGLEAFCGGTCNETDRSAQVSAHLAMACEATQVLAKPGMGVDEGLMIVGNEMARTAALVRAREAARP